MPSIIQKSPKNRHFQDKIGHFLAKKISWESLTLSWCRMYPFWIFKNYKNAPNYPKIRQKRSSLFTNRAFFAPKWIGSFQSCLYISKLDKWMLYAKFHPLWKLKSVETPLIISKSAKNGDLGAKWAIFGPKMCWKCAKLLLSSSAFIVDVVCWVSSILDFKKYRNDFNYPKIRQKRSFRGKNGPFLAPKWVRNVWNCFYLLQP